MSVVWVTVWEGWRGVFTFLEKEWTRTSKPGDTKVTLKRELGVNALRKPK